MPQHEPESSLPELVQVSNSWVSRYGDSLLLAQHDGPAGSDAISLKFQYIYGDSSHPLAFCIGNGGAGYTGILCELAELYIAQNGGDFRIGWVANHSRHSQVALLADVVHVALTYEPENEEIAIREGWAMRVGRVFNDHFILVGPDVDLSVRDIDGALRAIAESHWSTGDAVEQKDLNPITFHTRGDGSATYAKEQILWRAAGMDVATAKWITTYPLAPYDALVQAEAEQAFLLTDRATFLTAKRDGVIPSLHVHVEGVEGLLNPCSALVKSDAFVKREAGRLEPGADQAGARFARWLTGPQAQEVIGSYGRQWPLGKPLFTVAQEEEFAEEDMLASK